MATTAGSSGSITPASGSSGTGLSNPPSSPHLTHQQSSFSGRGLVPSGSTSSAGSGGSGPPGESRSTLVSGTSATSLAGGMNARNTGTIRGEKSKRDTIGSRSQTILGALSLSSNVFPLRSGSGMTPVSGHPQGQAAPVGPGLESPDPAASTSFGRPVGSGRSRESNIPAWAGPAGLPQGVRDAKGPEWFRKEFGDCWTPFERDELPHWQPYTWPQQDWNVLIHQMIDSNRSRIFVHVDARPDRERDWDRPEGELERERDRERLLGSNAGALRGKNWVGIDRGQVKPPAKALDVGCGPLAHWSVSSATKPGWEKTRFVALDTCPVLLPITKLPETTSRRIETVQSNFLDPEGLPFEDDSFDYVWLCDLGASIPEPDWNALLEECARVLAPNGVIEIHEITIRLPRRPDENGFGFAKPQPPSLTASGPHHTGRVLTPEALAELWAMWEGVYEARMINEFSSAVIAPLVPLSFEKVQRGGGTFSVPRGTEAAPKPLSPAADEHDVMKRVLTHAYAQRMYPLRHAVYREYSQNGQSSTNGKMMGANSITKQEFEHGCREFAGDLLDRAGLSGLVESKWGWECEFDKQAERILSQQVADIEDVATRAGVDLRNQGQLDSDKQALARVWSDVKAELEPTRKRINKTVTGHSEFYQGLFELGSWLATHPSREESDNSPRLRE